MGLILFPRPLSPAIPRIGFNARRFLFFCKRRDVWEKEGISFFSLDQYKGEGGKARSLDGEEKKRRRRRRVTGGTEWMEEDADK